MTAHKWTTTLLALLMTGHVYATQAPWQPFAEVIKEKGTVSITDGSSIFTFSKDGTFSQQPASISGRTVQGKWTTDSGGCLFTITGNWSWMNGMSPISDPRRMVMAIYHGDFVDAPQRPFYFYKCYFEIEEL